jgi:hypothetical protein
MAKKILAICAALVALAVVPAAASAAPELVYQSNTEKVPTGTLIQGTNVGETVMTTSLGDIKCTKALMTGTLNTNSGTAIEGTIDTADFTGTESEERCSGPLGPTRVTTNLTEGGKAVGVPWCIRATNTMEEREFQVRGGKCSEAARAMTFVLHGSILGFPVTCHYTKATVSGKYTTHPEDAILTIEKQKFTRVNALSSGSCPESGELDMKFTLETDEKTPRALSIL